MRFAKLREEAVRVELGIRRTKSSRSSLYLPKTLIAFEGRALTTKISEYFSDDRDNKHFKEIGRELRISTQAAWKRWKRKIEPAIKQVYPKFSSGSFKMSSHDSK